MRPLLTHVLCFLMHFSDLDMLLLSLSELIRMKELAQLMVSLCPSLELC